MHGTIEETKTDHRTSNIYKMQGVYEVVKRIAAVAALLLLSGSLSPVEAALLKPIDKDGLNLRAGPGTQHSVVGGLAQSETATVLGKEGDWYRIRLTSGTEGWVASWYSRILLDDEQRYAMVNTDVLNVRREPNLNAPILSRISQDQTVRLLEMIPEWWRVRLDDGTEGWVASTYMKQSTSAPVTPAPTAPVTPPPALPAVPVIPVGPSVPAMAPAAPEGTVPDLRLQGPTVAVPLSGKEVQVKAESGLFAGPNSEARRVDTLLPGETLRLLDAAGGWVRAESPRGKRGWVHGSLVQVIDGRLLTTMGERSWALQLLTVAQPPAAPATPIPAPATGADNPLRMVKDADGLNLRLVPAMTAQVLAVLPQGESMEVLQQDGVWLRVKTAGGLTGWVHSGYVLPVGGTAPAAPPAPTPVVSGTDFKVSMEEPFAGASRLVVVTAPGKPIGQPVLDGGTLTIPFESGEATERAVPLNIIGVRQASITPAGLKLTLVGQPNLTVEEAAPGKLSVLLRPVLQSITEEAIDGKAVFRFNVSGNAQPVAREAGSNIIIEIPGAVLAGPIGLPNIRVVQHEVGVRIAIPTYRAFSVKSSPQGFYVVTYPSGLAGKAILLDPGHGGDDGGAVSRLLGVVEKEVNLQVSLRLRALLEARGAKVYMTRSTDRRAAPAEFLNSAQGEPYDQLDMQYRTMLANQLKVDLFLSIHHNSGEPGLRGSETFYTSGGLNGERSKLLANLVQQELVQAAGTINRGAKDDTYYVTRNTEAPSALVEVAFVNDPSEGPRTKDPLFQEAVAQALLRAVERLYAERPQ